MRSDRFAGKKRMWRPILAAAALMLVFSVCGGCGIYTKYENYSGSGKYSTGCLDYRASEVSDVEINWVSGDVVIEQCGGDVLSVTEEGSGLLKDDQKMHWILRGDKLVIHYCRSGYTGSIPPGKKKLAVEVPEGINLCVNTVSGDIEAKNGRKYGKMDLRSVSGDIRVSISECDKMNIGTVSSDVTFLSLPDRGTAIGYSSLSGDLDTGKQYEKSRGRYVFGDGKCKIEVGTVSGDLLVK